MLFWKYCQKERLVDLCKSVVFDCRTLLEYAIVIAGLVFDLKNHQLRRRIYDTAVQIARQFVEKAATPERTKLLVSGVSGMADHLRVK